MSSNPDFDRWYAAKCARFLVEPKRRLETFGNTLVNYHLVSELEDRPGKIRVREGRLEAHRPLVITPDFSGIETEGLSDEAKAYAEFLRQHESDLRILRYGFRLKADNYTEYVVTDRLSAVTERVRAEVAQAGDELAAVIQGVDEPWDVSLVHFFWLHVNASAPVNVREFEAARQREMEDSTPRAVRDEVEAAFAKAQENPALVHELGALLQRKGVFDRYQDRFFRLVRRT